MWITFYSLFLHYILDKWVMIWYNSIRKLKKGEVMKLFMLFSVITVVVFITIFIMGIIESNKFWSKYMDRMKWREY